MASISVPDRVPSPTKDAKSIREAVKVFRTDVEAIIETLGHRTAMQRAGIAMAYEDLYDERLVDRLNGEFSSDLRNAMMMWTMDPAECDAKLAYEALHKRRDDLRRTVVLIEIACASLPGHLVAVKRCYRSTYASSPQWDVASCSPYEGPMKEFLVGLVSSDRPAGEHVDDVLVRADAAVLHSTVVAKKQLLHEDVIRIVSSRSQPQLKATFEHYMQEHGKPIDKVIRGSIIGLEYDPETLRRAIISRAEIDMKKVKEYKARFHTTVTTAIVGDLSGDYKYMLLTLVGPE